MFEGLSIWEDEAFRQLQGTYPVISLSFLGVEADSYEKVYADIKYVIKDLFRRHEFLMDSDKFTQHDRDSFSRIADGDVDESTITRALLFV